MDRSEVQRMLSAALNPPDVDSEEDDFEEFLEKLRFFFSENLVLAALDLVDRENVIRLSTPWGYSHFEILGSTGSYTVFPGFPSTREPGKYDSPPFCTCPAFAYAVLLSKSELMCKHLLAAAIARKLSQCVERTIGKAELTEVSSRQCS
ncbi:hypothetical protein EIP91_004464 [Steccherinum ochraceum]|uniref:SWIM-type domain-containing protein n=1 Tax=Steccherinum ochraceum TaxID=92696 RepID=A0A4R0RK68_9APHY|nr:hypothetical protein EIP91_004464 [Steccherinum ochraceum]